MIIVLLLLDVCNNYVKNTQCCIILFFTTRFRTHGYIMQGEIVSKTSAPIITVITNYHD